MLYLAGGSILGMHRTSLELPTEWYPFKHNRLLQLANWVVTFVVVLDTTL